MKGKTPPVVAGKTQAAQVYRYMKKRGSITSGSAISVLGITRLAAVINTMKKRGVAINTTYPDGFRARIAEYSLAK